MFDSGETGNFINIHGLEASLEFVDGVTISTVNAHCRRLLQRLEEGLCARGYILSAGVARPATNRRFWASMP